MSKSLRHLCSTLLLVLMVGLLLTSCSPSKEVVATIDGEAITRAEVSTRLKEYREEGSSEVPPPTVQQDQFSSAKAVLNQLINEHLLLLEAQRQGLFADNKEKPVGRQEAMEKVLSRLGKEVPFPNFKEARAYYNQYIDNFVVAPRYQLEHLLLNSENSAWELKERLDKEELSMAEAGRKQINGARIADSGKNRLVTAAELPPSLAKILPGLKHKIISPVIATPYGYHLIRIEKRLPAGNIPFAEVENRIKDTLFAQRLQKNYQHWLKQSKEQHTIEIFHQNLTDL